MPNSIETFESGSVRDTQQGKGRYDLLPPLAIEALAKHYEKGATKYEARNWEKGQPLSRYVSSGLRHAFQLLEGRIDEDHAVAAAWNFLAFVHTREMVRRGKLPAKLSDLPDHTYGGKLHVYIAGPYTTGGTGCKTKNTERATEAGLHVMKKGHFAHVPHAATHPWDGELEYEEFMQLDFSMIRRWATALLYLEPSPGADRELELARSLNLQIFNNVEEIPDAIQKT